MATEGKAATMGEAVDGPLDVSNFMVMRDGMDVKPGWLPIMSPLTPIPGDKNFGVHWRNVETNHTDIKLDIMAQIMNNGLGDPAKYGLENNTMMQLPKLDNDLMHFVIYKQVSGNWLIKVMPLS